MNYDEKIHIEKVKKRVPRWKSNFKQHFNHMSKMYSHNHAKVFEVSANSTITLWNPTDDGSLPKFITEVWER